MVNSYELARNQNMSAPINRSRESRITAAKAFAGQFNQYEWKDLCPYQWFLSNIDRSLETGDFHSLQVRAEETLVNDGLRRCLPGTIADGPDSDVWEDLSESGLY
jgi:hypothetical protein